MTSMNETRSEIHSRLAQAWNRERRFHHLRGLGQVLPWLVGLFLVDLLLDWGLEIPAPWARIVLLLGNLAAIGWLGYRYWLRHLHRFDATRVSLQVEKLHPRLENLLVSYVQLDCQNDPAHGSPQMIEAMRRQAESAIAPLDFRGIVNASAI